MTSAAATPTTGRFQSLLRPGQRAPRVVLCGAHGVGKRTMLAYPVPAATTVVEPANIGPRSEAHESSMTVCGEFSVIDIRGDRLPAVESPMWRAFTNADVIVLMFTVDQILTVRCIEPWIQWANDLLITDGHMRRGVLLLGNMAINESVIRRKITVQTLRELARQKQFMYMETSLKYKRGAAELFWLINQMYQFRKELRNYGRFRFPNLRQVLGKCTFM